MSGSEFGGMIRDAREDLGLSHTRLADLVGRSPSTVRAWERGQATPEETTVLSSLAAVLGLEERALFRAAGVAAPGPRSARTLEQTLSEIAPSALGASPRPAPADRPSAVERTVGTPLAAARQPEPAARPAFEASEPVRSGDHRPPSKVDLVLGRISGWRDAVRSAFPVRRAPRRPAVQSPPSPLPTTARSYVEVPEQRLLYRMRSVFLAIGLAVLVIVFVWAAKEFLDAIGASLDAIFGPE